MSGQPIDVLWDALWEDLRHNATGRPSGLLIITKHRYAIEAEARAAAVAPLEKALRAIKEGIEATAGDDPEGPVPSGIWYDIACAALSAPSPVREPEGLDVERLDRSMAAAGVHVDKARPGPTREIGCQSCREGIAAIAAEYARLTPERPADEVDG